jgi:hypothetical protein
MHFRSRTKRLASLDLFLNDFKITLGGEGNVFLKSPRYVSGSTRNGEFVDNQRGFPGVIFGFPVPAFLNRGRFLIGAPVPTGGGLLSTGRSIYPLVGKKN